MIEIFALVFMLGCCLTVWSLWYVTRQPIQKGIDSLQHWRRWHQDSLAWSRPKAESAGMHPFIDDGQEAFDGTSKPRFDPIGFMRTWQQMGKLRAIEKDTPELLAFLARAIRAGHSLTAAVIWAGETFPGAMGEAFSRIRTQLQCGIDLRQALNDLSLRYPLAELRMLVLGLRIAQELGGPLPDLLDQLASNSRARLQLRSRVSALSAEARWSGWFLAVLPIVLASGLSLWRPEHMAVLWADPRGQLLTLAAVSLSLGGGLWMKRLVEQVDA